jgi:hypothetical protein
VRAHPLDRQRSQRADFCTLRPPRLPDLSGRIDNDPLALVRALQDRAEQLERVPQRDTTGACSEPVGLPARDDLRRQRAQRRRAEERSDVPVVQARVVLARLRRKVDRVRRRPDVDEELVERLAPRVERRQSAELPPAPDLSVPCDYGRVGVPSGCSPVAGAVGVLSGWPACVASAVRTAALDGSRACPARPRAPA